MTTATVAGRPTPPQPRAPRRAGHYAKFVSAPGQELARDIDRLLPEDADVRGQRRFTRGSQQEILWTVSKVKRIRECARIPWAPKGQHVDKVRCRLRDGVAHWLDLATCGSSWACPRCEPVIANHRALEIAHAADVWDRAGNTVVMAVLTVRHHQGLRLADLLKGEAGAFRFMIKGRPWRRVKEALGVAGIIRSPEVTVGRRNGWHPHVNLLFFIRGDLDPEGLALLYAHLQERWKAAAAKFDLGPPDDRHGVKVEVCHSAAEAGLYVAKSAAGRSVGNEMARGDLKTGRKGEHVGRTPFEVLEDFRQTGDAADLALWHEYELATRHHQKIAWSKGLRAVIAELGELEEEQTDEEIAATEVGGDHVLSVDLPTHHRIVRIPGLRVLLLDAAERGGTAAMIEMGKKHGVRIVDRGS